MRVRVGIEDMEPGRWIAWAFELPGCTASGHSEYEVVGLVPQRVVEHLEWLRYNGIDVHHIPEHVNVDIVEVFYAHHDVTDPTYRINAYFQDDRKPLTGEDVTKALDLLSFTRADLNKVLSHIMDEERLKPRPTEKGGSIDGLLQHLAGAEWWYLDRLEMAPPMEQMPEDTLTRLEWVRDHLRGGLVEMIGKRKTYIWNGEEWSARKLVRRALWHERDHTEHIAHLIDL